LLECLEAVVECVSVVIVNHQVAGSIHNSETFRRGLASLVESEDYTVKGAVDFLKTLRRAGVTLYLASGSDDADLHEDATRLGYADLFNGGLYGSLGEAGKDAKKLVIERILREVEGSYDHLAAFGDGPVEMRETVKRGGYAIGIASDEIRRFGLNLKKRQRLIHAGACLVIPDFSQPAKLCEYLRLSTGCLMESRYLSPEPTRAPA
jgi:phosphoglycolate phosphatase-like HAD superfamily hydrolase